MSVPNATSKEANSPPPNIGVAILIALGGVIAILMLLGIERARPSIAACKNGQLPLTTIQGNVRKAGEDYYLVSEGNWHLPQSRCPGKIRKACLEETGNAELWLYAHLGAGVSARICAHGIVDYTVAERSFSR
ncbi:hypothetical protein [Azonexus sp. IMCC34839]|uniref:hypothetical protein n=1 Tax=Azonexus sp. IMCC34839 TaxID=3133695 RepID=UPI00399BF2EE